MKFYSGFLVVFIFLLGCGSPEAQAPKKAAEQAAAVGAAAPQFTLPANNGKQVSLADFKGQVVLLDFWATWCPPCRISTPALVRLNKKINQPDFKILGISLDENLDSVQAYLKKTKLEHLILYGKDSSVADAYRISSIPTFYLLDRNGIIQKSYEGFSPDMEQEWEKEVKSLLAK